MKKNQRWVVGQRKKNKNLMNYWVDKISIEERRERQKKNNCYLLIIFRVQ